ncbi:MAG: TetR/AcrR family transcriptional regulator [Polyangiales bacterium]
MSEELRTRILDAAIHLLETEGPKAFGQIRVAREAGLAQGHLTYYFKKKSDLAVAVCERLHERNRREFDRILARAGELPQSELHDQFFAQVAKMMRDKKRSRALLGLMVEALDDSAIAAIMAKQVLVQRSGMALLLGRSPDDVEVHIALAALRGLGLENLLAPPDADDSAAIIARFRSWFLNGPGRAAR